jgi:hypothetical protein
MRALLALKRLIASAALLLALPLSLFATTYEPSTAISLDFRNMNPPVMTHGMQGPGIQLADRSVQLIARPQQLTTWQWQLRSPFVGTRYSTLVMRYRASGLLMSPTDPVLRIESAAPSGISVTLPVVAAADLVQDGRMRELRRDLSQLPDASLISALQFTAVGAPAGGTLDLFDITFETGSHPAATISSRTQGFSVTDSNGKPVAGAEVHYGLLERSNWVAVGRTDPAGKVTLTAPFPGDTALPAEATVEMKDYAPQFIAPIDPANGLALAVKLQPTSEPVGGSRPANMPPPPAQPAETTAPPVPSDYYQQPGYSEPYDYGYYPAYPPYGYGYPGYGYGWPAGYTWSVVVSSNNGHHHHHDKAECRPHATPFAQHPSQPIADPNHKPIPPMKPIRAGSPSSSNAPISVSNSNSNSNPPIVTAPGHAVITAPSFGVVTAPSTPVITAPTKGVNTAPSARSPVSDPPAPRARFSTPSHHDSSPMPVRSSAHSGHFASPGAAPHAMPVSAPHMASAGRAR